MNGNRLLVLCREAAILALLAPGNSTAVVRGKDDTIGVALVEAYNLQ